MMMILYRLKEAYSHVIFDHTGNILSEKKLYISVEYAASDTTMPVTGSIQLQYNTAYIQMVLLLVPQYCEVRPND